MWDVFVSHASEDKDEVARPLAKGLEAGGLSVFFDEWSVKVGDSLRREIDRGMAESRFGVIILSHQFFRKQWVQRELDGLTTLEVNSGMQILPVWHGVTQKEVASFSAPLGDKSALLTSNGIDHVIQAILRVVRAGPAPAARTRCRRRTLPRPDGPRPPADRPSSTRRSWAPTCFG
jgi:hypothetical protein